jgi:hypothetical protein
LNTKLQLLTEQVKALEERLAHLELVNATLRDETRTSQGDAETAVSRRNVLQRSAAIVGAGVGLAVAGSVLGTGRAQAAYGDPMLLGKSNTADNWATLITSSHGAFTFRVSNTSGGAGSDDALEALSTNGRAIWARSSSATRPSIQGDKEVAGAALVGIINLATGTSNAIEGTTHGAGAGVFGNSSKGRGGILAGAAAQVRLMPSSLATHPASGLAGDLFLDTSKRLWLCKGGTTWVKVV